MITCRSSALLLAALLGLSGCGEGANNPLAGLSLAPSDATPPETARAISEAELAGGALRLTPPEGWCIEPRSLHNTPRSSFALIAGCNELTDGKVGGPSPAGYITVSVGPAQIAEPATDSVLTAVVQDAAGAERSTQNNISRAKLTRDAKSAPGPVWRLASLAGKRAVLVTVHAKGGTALAGRDGLDIATKIAASLGGGTQSSDVASGGAKTEATSGDTTTGGLDLGRVFGRFLNGNNSE